MWNKKHSYTKLQVSRFHHKYLLYCGEHQGTWMISVCVPNIIYFCSHGRHKSSGSAGFGNNQGVRIYILNILEKQFKNQGDFQINFCASELRKIGLFSGSAESGRFGSSIKRIKAFWNQVWNFSLLNTNRFDSSPGLCLYQCLIFSLITQWVLRRLSQCTLYDPCPRPSHCSPSLSLSLSPSYDHPLAVIHN